MKGINEICFQRKEKPKQTPEGQYGGDAWQLKASRKPQVKQNT